MITPDYCRTMARYNAWQNEQVTVAADGLTDAARREPRGAFFGSIAATLSHLLWADEVWMNRIGDWPRPAGSIDGSMHHAADWGAWRAGRRRIDRVMLGWAAQVDEAALRMELTWTSGVTGQTTVQSRSYCAAHMFNHQTHHRGQIHAMLTAAGATAPISDLLMMPQGDAWL